MGEMATPGRWPEDFVVALDHLRSIGCAEGILMEHLKITPDEAFALLWHVSQDTELKLVTVARRLMETGGSDGPGNLP
jgi:response regulator NasT